MKRRGLKWLLLLGVLLAGGIGAGIIWQNQHTYHLAAVQQGVLYRDGAKSIRQFSSALDEVHPRTVVSLVDQNEESDPNKPQFGQEAQLCMSRGIQLDRIEVKLGGWPGSDDIRRFLTVVADRQKQPVLVHCAQGVRRTGFFVAAFQMSVLGFDKARAKDAILSFGHSDNTINDIRRFIDDYDPKTQTVSSDLGRKP